MANDTNLFRQWLKERGVAFDDALSLIGEGVVLIGRDYVVGYQNEAHKALMGDREGELCYKAFRGRNSVCEECRMQKCFADGKVRVFETVKECKAGARRLRITAKPLIESGGTGLALTQVAVDITDRAMGGRSEPESLDILMQIAEHVHSMIYLLEADMSRVHYANSAYERIWGRPVGGLYDDPLEWMKAIVPDDLEKIKPEVVDHKGPKNYMAEYRITRPNGEIRYIEDKGFPIFDSAGNHVRYAGVATDITEQKEAEARKVGVYQMLKHDLKSSLTLIKGNMDLLRVNLSATGSMSTECDAAFDAVSRNADIIGRVLDDLALFAEMDAGDYGLKFERVPVESLLQGVSVMYGGVAESRGVALLREAEPGLPEIMVDESLVTRALVNIVMNAVNHSGGDMVTLSAARSEFDGVGCVSISVSDNGRGIPPEFREKVFMSHFRIPSKPKVYGSGLGLTIVKQVAEVHSGRVELSGSPGEGCTFTLTLPVTQDTQTGR